MVMSEPSGFQPSTLARRALYLFCFVLCVYQTAVGLVKLSQHDVIRASSAVDLESVRPSVTACKWANAKHAGKEQRNITVEYADTARLEDIFHLVSYS